MRAAMIVLLAALAALGAGCGGSDDSAAPPVPEGYRELRGPDWTLAHPAGWSVEAARRGSGGGSVREVLGTPGSTGLPPQVVVGRSQQAAGDLEAAALELKTDNRVRRSRWTVLSEKPVEVAGARAARMIEARYLEVAGAGTAPVRTVDLLVRTPDGAQLDVLVRAPEADFDRSGLRKVLETFRVR
jgi:hypothetical protein